MLAIDARKQSSMISRVQIEFTDKVIACIANTVAAWRGDQPARPEIVEGQHTYTDIPGFCRGVKLAEIAQHGHVFNPSRHVGAEDVEDNDEDFAAKMVQLTEKLG